MCWSSHRLSLRTLHTSCWRGLAKPKPSARFCWAWARLIHVLQTGDEVNNIVQIAAVAVMDAMNREELAREESKSKKNNWNFRLRKPVDFRSLFYCESLCKQMIDGVIYTSSWKGESFMSKIKNIIKIWLPFAVVITAFCRVGLCDGATSIAAGIE